jgi:transketolase
MLTSEQATMSPWVLGQEKSDELAWRAHRMRRHIVQMATDRIKLHFGGSLSMVDILSVLYFHWMRHNPRHPDWPDRDRFVLSKGHGAPGLYAALGEADYFSVDEFSTFRSLHSILQGHPDRTKTPGVEVTSGSLGLGFPTACGLALAAQMDKASWRVYAMLGDGECNEGSVWEAALIAGNMRLERLTAILDRNRMSSYGPMAGRNDIEPLVDKWHAFNWHVVEVDGHNAQSIVNGLVEAVQTKGKPTILIAHTVKGYGIPTIERTARHNFKLSHEQYLQVMRELDEQKAALKEVMHV